MNRSEKVLYLTNLLIAARSDGEILPSEEAFVESVRKRLKAKKADLKEAGNAATAANIDVTSFRQLSTAVQNIEELALLLMLNCGQEVIDNELVQKAITATGIGTDATKALFEGVKDRYASEAGICPSCRTKNDANAKFCNTCGSPMDRSRVDDGKGVATSLTPAQTGVTVAFAESTAAGFGEALRVAREQQTFQQYVNGRKPWYAASFSLVERSQLLSLVRNLKGMRNREVYIDGELRQWQAVFAYTYCAVRRESSFRPTEFCFGEEEYTQNCWGCQKLDLPWTDWAEWFRWGRFVDEKTFEFDLPRIEHELRLKKQSVDLCPYFREGFFESVLKKFPRRVTVEQGGDWDYAEHYGGGGTSFEVQVSVDYGLGDVEIETREVNGVQPTSRKPALAIMKAAAEAARIPFDDLPSR